MDSDFYTQKSSFYIKALAIGYMKKKNMHVELNGIVRDYYTCPVLGMHHDRFIACSCLN